MDLYNASEEFHMSDILSECMLPQIKDMSYCDISIPRMTSNMDSISSPESLQSNPEEVPKPCIIMGQPSKLNVKPSHSVNSRNGHINMSLPSSVLSRGSKSYQQSYRVHDLEIDVVEYATCYKFFLDIPGVDEKTLRINAQSHYIVIKGEKNNRYSGCERILYKHRKCGRFCHQIPYNPALMDVSKANASFSNGELCISIMKKSIKPF